MSDASLPSLYSPELMTKGRVMAVATCQYVCFSTTSRFDFNKIAKFQTPGSKSHSPSRLRQFSVGTPFY